MKRSVDRLGGEVAVNKAAQRPAKRSKKLKRPKGWFEVHALLDMVVENGQRWWKIRWAGVDENGDPWDDSWEKSSMVSEDLRIAYLNSMRERVPRIEVDVRPLNEMVARSVHEAVAAELGKTFGVVHTIPLRALALRDLAVYYFNSVIETYGLEEQELFNPGTRTTTKEVMLKDQEAVGKFCGFEKFMAGGFANLRYKLGRKQNVDAVYVASVLLRMKDSAHCPGTVVFEAEVKTCKVNGRSGQITPPHQVTGFLTKDHHMRAVYSRVREILPRKHRLISRGYDQLTGTDYLPVEDN